MVFHHWQPPICNIALCYCLNTWAISKFRSTRQYANADGLSRLPLQTESVLGRLLYFQYISHIESLPVRVPDIMSATHTNPVLAKVWCYLEQGWPQKVPPELLLYWCRRHELTIKGDCVLWRMRVVIPAKFQSKVLAELHHGNQGIVRMKTLAKSQVW